MYCIGSALTCLEPAKKCLFFKVNRLECPSHFKMDPRKLSAQELVQLCLASQDEALWTEFVRRFQPLIARVIARRICRQITYYDPALIDDLVGDTFIKICTDNFKVLRKFSFQHENALYGFLKVVAANVAEDYFRRLNSEKRNHGRAEEDLEEVQATTPASHDFHGSMERQILLKEIDTRLQQLAGEPNYVRDSRIFWLYYGDGMTAQAISELPEIGLSVKGVESTLLRLIKWLRGKLK